MARSSTWGGGLRTAAEPGRADALAVERFGLPGGDLRGTGEDLGQQVQQVCAFVCGQSRQDALLQGADAGKQLVGGGPAVRGDLDQRAAPVTGVGDAADPAAVLEQVKRGGHGGRGDEHPVADLGWSQRSTRPVDNRQGRRGGLRDAEGHPDAPVNLAQQRLAGAAQRGVGLGAGPVGAGVLLLETGVDPDHAERGGGGTAAATPPPPRRVARFRHP